MAIETKNLSALQAYQKYEQTNTQTAIKNLAADGSNKTSDIDAQKASTTLSKSEIRIEQQASLVSHLFGDGKTAEQSSLKITYQSAIEKLNEILMAQMPEYAQTDTEGGESQNIPGYQPISEEALQEQGGMDYWTPENTAKRIVDGASAFFTGFQNAHPELEGEALMNHFMDVVVGGLKQGFEEARGILGDLEVFEGPIEENFNKTFDLVESGMQTYQADYLAKLNEVV